MLVRVVTQESKHNMFLPGMSSMPPRSRSVKGNRYERRRFASPYLVMEQTVDFE